MTSIFETLTINNNYQYQDPLDYDFQNDSNDDGNDDQVVPVCKPSRKQGVSKHDGSADTVASSSISHEDAVMKTEYSAWLELRGELGRPKYRRAGRSVDSDSDTESFFAGSVTSAPAASNDEDDGLELACDKSRTFIRRRNHHLHRVAAVRLHHAVLNDEEVWWANQHARGDKGRDSGYVRRKQDCKAMRNKARKSGKGGFKYDIKESL